MSSPNPNPNPKGKLYYYKNMGHTSGCEPYVSVSDHKLNPQLGILTLEVVCGARKNSRAKVLLSAGAKNLVKELLEKAFEDYLNEGGAIEFIEREGKIPKLIATQNGNKDILLLGVYGSGFRGSVGLTPENGAKNLIYIGSCQAWGCLSMALTHLPPSSRLVVERTGRRYGSAKYIVIINQNGKPIEAKVDDLSELEE